MNLLLLMVAFMITDLSNDLLKSIPINLPMTVFAQSTNSTPNIEIKKVTLLAREEKNPPIGQPPTPDRDIGFASVFVRLENNKQTVSKITITGISIVNANNQIEDFEFFQKEITLRPLENSEHVFELRNKIGYFASDRVKAVVTYQIDNQVSFIDSEVVKVSRL